jgi:hypothetical protein
MGDGVNFY